MAANKTNDLMAEYLTLTGDIRGLSRRLALPMGEESRRAIVREAQLKCERRMLVAAALGLTPEAMAA